MPRPKKTLKDAKINNVTRNTFQLLMGESISGAVNYSNKTTPRSFRQQGATLNGRTL